MKVFMFKFLTTALFLLLTLFAAGFAAHSTPADPAAGTQTAAVARSDSDLLSFSDGATKMILQFH